MPLETLRLTSSLASDSLAFERTIQTPEKQLPSLPAPHLDLIDMYCILQIEPNDTLVAIELARQLGERERWSEAVRILRAVIRMDYRGETLFALGQAEYHADDLKPAFSHLQTALVLLPEGSPLFFDLLKTLGNIFVRQGDFHSAEDSYHKAYRLRPESDELQVNLGTLAVQRQEWDAAVEHFRQALRVNSVNDKAWAGLAIGHRMKGDCELAWGNIEAALQVNPLNEVALTLALDWGIADKCESRVLELLRGFLVSGGWNEKFSLAFAWLSFRRGRRDLAVFELERLLAVNPGHAAALALAREMRATT